MLTAEVKSPGITCVNTYGFTFGSSTGFAEETAIQEEEPREVYTLPSTGVARAQRHAGVVHAAAGHLHARGSPSAAAASAVSVPMISRGGHDLGKERSGRPLARMNSGQYLQPSRS